MKRFRDVLIDEQGNVRTLVQVEVRLKGTTTKAVLYGTNDVGGGTIGNPVMTDGSDGTFWFYVADGTYDLAIAPGAAGGFTVPDVEIYDLDSLVSLTLSEFDAKIAVMDAKLALANLAALTASNAANSLAVVAVGANLAGANTIGTVAGSIGNVNNTGNNIANVNLVGGSIANVNLTGGSIANVNTVAGIVANINTVAGIAANVTIVAGSAAAVGTVAADLALGAGASFILRAPQAAIDAVAAAASVPAGAGTYIEANGPPGYNVGTTGAWYYDLTNGYLYGPKTASGWSAGVALVRSSPVASDVIVDMRTAGAAFPTAHWTFTRASASTDMLYSDPYTFAPTAFGNDVPVMRAGKGFGAFMKAQQFLTNPGAPATHTTVGSVAVGVAVLLAWGPAGTSVTVSAGTAVGTGWGTLNGDAGSFLALTISTAGTITVTVTGALTKFNLQQNPTWPAVTEPVPYISTTGTREADKAVHTATMLTLLNSTAAYLLMGISNVSGRSFARAPTPLGINTVSAGYFATATSYTIYDPANHNSNASLGAGNVSTDAGVTIGRTWDATASVTFGGGNRFEYTLGFQHNNGVAATAARLGDNVASDTYGGQMLNGFIGWYKFGQGRLTAEALYGAYTSTPVPTLDGLLKGYVGPSQFPKFLSAYRLMQAGVTDHVKVGIAGPSHEGGTGAGTNVRLNGWPPQMVASLEAEGYAVTDDTFNGVNGQTFATATNAFDGRLTYAGGTPTLAGVQFGGDVIVIPSGGTLTFTAGRATSRFVVGLYTAAAGYGAAEISVDGGATPIASTETGGTSNSTTAAASLITRTFNAALGANAWTIKAVGNPVHVSFGYAYNPLLKQIIVFNGGRSGFVMSTLAQDTAPENSYMLPIRTLAFPLLIGGVDQTNDMTAGGTDWTTIYDPKSAAFIANARLNGDMLGLTDPPPSTATYTQAVQDKVVNQARGAFWKATGGPVPFYDFYGWKAGIFATLSTMAYYGTDTTHLDQRGQKRGKGNQIAAFLKRLIAAA
ncbi:MAG: hypothetical protein ABI395_00580 [Sphingobium sp.]